MKTLDELIYYCNEPEPVGALLLSGEWGCGKTYLIENNLQSSLEQKSKILRNLIIWNFQYRGNTHCC